METEENETMESGDYVLSPCGPLLGLVGVSIVEGKFLGQFQTETEALEFIRHQMEREKFWPNIWYVSDHGNLWPVSF